MKYKHLKRHQNSILLQSAAGFLIKLQAQERNCRAVATGADVVLRKALASCQELDRAELASQGRVLEGAVFRVKVELTYL